MTRHFHITIPGPHERQLRRRLAELRADGLCILRLITMPEAERMTREERCAAILQALDAPVRPVSEVGRSAA